MTQSVENETRSVTGYILTALTFLLGASLFLLMGNSHEPTLYGPSIVSWLISQWQNPAGQSQHGWLIPLISIFVLYRTRRQLIAAPRKIDLRAIPIIILSLILYWIGFRSQQPRMGVICLIMLTWAIPFYLFGKELAKLLVFPSAYLVLAMPMEFLSAFTFPLRLFACKASVFILNGLCIPVLREGTAIYSAEAEGLRLNIADPCSGLQSVIALTALTALYAYLAQKGSVRKWILFLSSVPLAIAANIVRIITIALVYVAFGPDLAMRLYHDYSGFLVFVVAIVLMTSISALLNKIGEAEREHD